LNFQLRPACGLHEYTSQAALEHTECHAMPCNARQGKAAYSCSPLAGLSWKCKDDDDNDDDDDIDDDDDDEKMQCNAMQCNAAQRNTMLSC
jgi:hypothetical protein